MPSITINALTVIESHPANTILETMEQAGLRPEYHGHCGACRCELVSGEVEYIGFAMAYTQEKQILPCICKAKTDLTIAAVNYCAAPKRA